ncbi:hypothetical protein P3T76_015151 [Phytophthora citrophthora]|uniref:Uncharacterized protein n=1 Tax=Phytophthora citrophthora TaxID=4793 RepID=A0AAD9FZV8_9STRA|nr:hypothetical protein P3T76_015151 [Phytophthora citrophthora]
MDGYNEAKDPPMVIIPFCGQTWVQYVKWVSYMELQPGYQCRHGKRKSRTDRKREKRFKLLLE